MHWCIIVKVIWKYHSTWEVGRGEKGTSGDVPVFFGVKIKITIFVFDRKYKFKYVCWQFKDGYRQKTGKDVHNFQNYTFMEKKMHGIEKI